MLLALRHTLRTGVITAIVATSWLGQGLAQERYSPATPTVSPYLNLFQNNRNGGFNRAVPNYYSLVRPQIQQQRFNQQQLNSQQAQNNEILQLQTGVNGILRQQQTGQQVVTGHGSWFENGGTRSRFLDTSTYFSRAGTAAIPPRQLPNAKTSFGH